MFVCVYKGMQLIAIRRSERGLLQKPVWHLSNVQAVPQPLMLPSANISVMFAEVMSQPSLWPMTCGLTLATQVQPDLRKDCESFEVENSPSFTQVQITKINQCQTDPSA